jgi:DNA-binding CsgD family transcriptional regulator/tetratricopeptide (TPR) repeat protein
VVELSERGAFVGRGAELDRLRQALRRTSEGRGGAAIVGGEAGIGKSRLVERFADDARADGAAFLTGACLEFREGGVPYAPFVEVLRGLARTTEPERLPALLGPGRVELGRLLPELGVRRTAQTDDRTHELDQAAQGRLFEAVLAVLERVARSSTVVVAVEDVQWSDRGTRDLLGFLVRSLRRERVLFVITARSEELHRRGPVLPFLAELELDEGVERIELRPFDRDEVAELIGALMDRRPEPELVDAVFERTNGNPFFAEQLVEAIEDAGGDDADVDLPPQLRDILLARISTFPEATREILRAASAAGRRTDDALLAAVTELPERQVAASLREAVGRGVLVDAVPVAGVDGGYGFRHTMLREVVYGELFTGERQRLHARFAQALEARGEVGGVPVGPADLAYHWDAARDVGHALPALVAAGREAERVYAWSEARDHYARALELWEQVPDAERLSGEDRASLLLRSAEMSVLLGSYRRAVELGRAAVEAHAAGPAADPFRAGALHERLRWFLWESGDRIAATAAVEEALSLIPADPPSAPRARALAHQAALLLFGGNYDEARARADEAVTAARSAAAAAEEALALGILGWAQAVLGEIDAGVALFRDGLDIARRLGGAEGICLGYTNLSTVLQRVGRPDEALEAALEGIEVARGFGVERTYGGLLLGNAAESLIDLGRWTEARSALDTAFNRAPAGRPEIWLRIMSARLDTRQGRFDAAAGHLRAARELDPIGGHQYHAPLLAGLAELGVWQDRSADVRATVDEGLRLAAEEGAHDPAFGWLAAHALRAEADAAARARARRAAAPGDGLPERVTALTALLAERTHPGPHSGRKPAPGDAALEALLTAERARLDGVAGSAVWATAVEEWQIIARPYETAYARFRLAEAALGAREGREVAAGALRSAHLDALRLDADPLRREIEMLARHARIDLPRSVGRAAPNPGATDAVRGLGLTDREEEVLRLVAGGWSNQQIAGALFISRKTASVHVSNILGKLGVGSRVEAAAVAHRLGFGGDAPAPPDRRDEGTLG